MQPYAAVVSPNLRDCSTAKPLNKNIILKIAAVAHKLNRCVQPAAAESGLASFKTNVRAATKLAGEL
jgi:hypothetical protein